MKIVILEAESLGEDMKLDRFFEIGEVAIYGKTTLEELPGRIAEADAVIVNKLPMNEETLKDAQYLKYIGLTATGTNNIDFDYTNKRGITVTNVAGYSTEVVAQHTFAMTLYLLEHLRYYDDYVRSGEYAIVIRSVIWSANSASFPGRPGGSSALVRSAKKWRRSQQRSAVRLSIILHQERSAATSTVRLIWTHC